MTTKYYVALDLGTNSVIQLTALATEHGAFETVDEQLRIPRLGEGLAENGGLKPEAMDRTLDAVAEVLVNVEETTEHGCAVAAATSAVREADNRHAFLERFSERFHSSPYIISGQEEARTTFLGVASDQGEDTEILNIDIGGGSTEYGIGKRGFCRGADSLPLGCVKLTERFGLEGECSDGQIQRAYEYAREEISRVGEDMSEKRIQQPPEVLASGGTATTYAAYKTGVAPYEHKTIHGVKGERGELAEIVDTLCRMDTYTRTCETGISVERAPVLPAGLIILMAVLDQIGSKNFSVTARGLRFGLIVRMHAGELTPTWTW